MPVFVPSVGLRFLPSLIHQPQIAIGSFKPNPNFPSQPVAHCANKALKSQASIVQNISHHINTLADRIYALRTQKPRIIVAIAGAPGSGKSTLAAELSRRLTAQKTANAVVPMDGFHFDNSVLEARGLLQRKGAPETFDSNGLLRLIKAIHTCEDAVAPTFERTRDIAIAGAIPIAPDCPVVIVEGNYLLYNQPPWAALYPYWDVTAFVDVPMPELRARMIQRWLSLNHSRTVATRRTENNDMPNAQSVYAHLIEPQYHLTAHR